MTDDITNDLALLDDWLSGKGYGEEAGLCMRAMDLIRKQADEIEKLRRALYDIYEVYAGSEGFPAPQTCSEAYLMERMMEMVAIAAEHKK